MPVAVPNAPAEASLAILLFHALYLFAFSSVFLAEIKARACHITKTNRMPTIDWQTIAKTDMDANNTSLFVRGLRLKFTFHCSFQQNSGKKNENGRAVIGETKVCSRWGRQYGRRLHWRVQCNNNRRLSVFIHLYTYAQNSFCNFIATIPDNDDRILLLIRSLRIVSLSLTSTSTRPIF